VGSDAQLGVASGSSGGGSNVHSRSGTSVVGWSVIGTSGSGAEGGSSSVSAAR
jgi:hypothetical protein